MIIDQPEAYQSVTELALMQRILPLKNADIVELGCGKAVMTRALSQCVEQGTVVATEVDEVQHQLNLQISDLSNVTFVFGGAEKIDVADASVDVVLMFKSLHHVPESLMGAALEEIARVLKPGGLAYISEPVFRGSFNEVLRLFHDEQSVRQQAFDAVKNCVDNGVLTLVEQQFFNAELHFDDFEQYQSQVMNVTHTEHRLSETLMAEVKATFERSMSDDGADFVLPIRVDLLRKTT